MRVEEVLLLRWNEWYWMRICLLKIEVFLIKRSVPLPYGGGIQGANGVRITILYLRWLLHFLFLVKWGWILSIFAWHGILSKKMLFLFLNTLYEGPQGGGISKRRKHGNILLNMTKLYYFFLNIGVGGYCVWFQATKICET